MFEYHTAFPEGFEEIDREEWEHQRIPDIQDIPWTKLFDAIPDNSGNFSAPENPGKNRTHSCTGNLCMDNIRGIRFRCSGIPDTDEFCVDPQMDQ